MKGEETEPLYANSGTQTEKTPKSKPRFCDKETIDLATLATQIILVGSYVVFCVLIFIIVA